MVCFSLEFAAWLGWVVMVVIWLDCGWLVGFVSLLVVLVCVLILGLVLCDSCFVYCLIGVWGGYLRCFDCCCMDLLVNSVVLILLFN